MGFYLLPSVTLPNDSGKCILVDIMVSDGFVMFNVLINNPMCYKKHMGSLKEYSRLNTN